MLRKTIALVLAAGLGLALTADRAQAWGGYRGGRSYYGGGSYYHSSSGAYHSPYGGSAYHSGVTGYSPRTGVRRSAWGLTPQEEETPGSLPQSDCSPTMIVLEVPSVISVVFTRLPG